MAKNCDCTGTHVSSDCKNLFRSWQATPKSVTALQIGIGGYEEVCGVLGECPENEN